VAVPAIEALRYTKLKEQYANLIATSMDSATAVEAHPAFVEILKQLTPDEAKILQFFPRIGQHEPLVDLGFELPEKGNFIIYRHASTIANDAGCSADETVPQHIDNLWRLGLTDIPAVKRLAEDWRYHRIRNLAIIDAIKAKMPEGARFRIEQKIFGITIIGESFRAACIAEPKPTT